jgi:hypothetical protein
MHDPVRKVYKIGVTNQFEFRIREHRRYGFVPLELPDGVPSVWPVAVGEQALAIEDTVLQLWRVGLRLPQALTPEDMPQNGATETARLSPSDLALTLQVVHRELRARNDTSDPAAPMTLF